MSTSERDFAAVKAALKAPQGTAKTYCAVFEKHRTQVLNADAAFVHNMGLLAARAGLVAEAQAIAMDLMDSGHPGSAVAIAVAGQDPTKYRELLETAAKTGHFRARSLMLKDEIGTIPLIGPVIVTVLRLKLVVQGVAAALTDPTDPRIDRGPR